MREDAQTAHVVRATLHRMAQATRYNRWLMDMVRPHVGTCVLDVGCGLGTFVPLAAQAHTFVALEADPQLLDEARQRWTQYANVHFCLGDITDPATVRRLRRWPFDTVLFLNVLEHIADDRRALDHARDLLAPNGRLVLYVPAGPRLYGRLDAGLGHRRRYTRRGLTRLLRETALHPVVCRPVNTLGLVGWWLDNLWGRWDRIPTWQIRLFDAVVPFWQPWERALRRLWPDLPGLSLLCVAIRRD